ncbi:MAG: hypothetical protein LBK95_21525 [Bifidobacteriaceae bacterium]|nr:hypothetical protein [Bifidobacteriaceae bacterium]
MYDDVMYPNPGMPDLSQVKLPLSLPAATAAGASAPPINNRDAAIATAFLVIRGFMETPAFRLVDSPNGYWTF